MLLFASTLLTVLFFELTFRIVCSPQLPGRIDNTKYTVNAPPEMLQAFTWDGDGNSLAHVRSDNPILVYELRPGIRLNDFIVTNKYGFRDYEYEKEKTDNTFRICVIGDSITFGWWECLEHTYPKVLERLLRERCSGDFVYEVLNMGIGGYNAEQEMELIRTQALLFNPDLLVIGYCINDNAIGMDAGLWRHFSSSGSVLWDWVSLRMKQIKEAFSFKSLLHRAYEKIAEIAHENNLPVIVVFFYPRDADSIIEYPAILGIQKAKRISEHLGFGIVDLRNIFKAYKPEDVMVDDIHPSVLGHRIAAEALFNYLVRSSRLPDDCEELPSSESNSILQETDPS